jgi:hypothetical protein
MKANSFPDSRRGLCNCSQFLPWTPKSGTRDNTQAANIGLRHGRQKTDLQSARRWSRGNRGRRQDQEHQRHPSRKRKMIWLCRHKMQQKTISPQRNKIGQIPGLAENQQGNQESLGQTEESEWHQLQALEKLCHQQWQELEVETHLHGHHHNENDFHMFDGHGKSDPDDSDLEYITAILGSFTNIKTMQPHKNREPLKNFSSGEVYEDAAFHTCRNHQMTPPKFNYELIIKTLPSQKFSCEPTLDTDTEDHWTKIDIRHKIFESPEAISSIARSQRGSPFSTWCPFIPSNSHSDSSQNSPTQPSSQLSSTPRSFSPELLHKSVTTNSPFMTNWCPKISSVAYSHPNETRNWKQHYSPVYLAKPADPWQSALRMEAIQKGMKVLYQQME